MSELDTGDEYLLAYSDEEYFDTIKPSESYLSKLNRLKDHLPQARIIASLGIAGGEDLCTLAKLYGEGTRLIGIDISPVALDLAQRATSASGVKAEFIEGNAARLNISDRSIDGFVLSAMLHEVYSYAEDGKDAFVRVIEEVYRTTTEGGCIYISDFAAPRIEGQVRLRPKSKEAEGFIEYFANNFRKFNDIESQPAKPFCIQDHRCMGYGSVTGDLLISSPAFVSEILWHFKHYRKKFDKDPGFDSHIRGWKEINEVYLPPNPLLPGYKPMPIDSYTSAVLEVCRSTGVSRSVSLRCMSAVLAPQRTDTVDMLDEHFSLVLNDAPAASKSLIIECTNWMDLVFKKERIK